MTRFRLAILLILIFAVSSPTLYFHNFFSPVVADSYPSPDGFVYGVFTDQNGLWHNPEPPNVAIPAVLKSGARFVDAGNGAPPSPQIAPYFQQLINAGLVLEVRLNPLASSHAERSMADIQQEAITLKQSGYYQAIFIDHALEIPDIQQVVDMLHSVGWTLIRTNESGFGTPRGVANPPSGVWVHSSHFDVLSAKNFNGVATGAIDGNDVNYINYIKTNFPGSYAVLKLEIPTETDVFASLSYSQQSQLLTSWAQDQSVYGYKMIYPLFSGEGGTNPYDSIAAGTYSLQVSLMAEYNPATSSLNTSTGSSTTSTTTLPITSTSGASSSTVVPEIPGFPPESLLAGVLIGLAIIVGRRRAIKASE